MRNEYKPKYSPSNYAKDCRLTIYPAFHHKTSRLLSPGLSLFPTYNAFSLLPPIFTPLHSSSSILNSEYYFLKI